MADNPGQPANAAPTNDKTGGTPPAGGAPPTGTPKEPATLLVDPGPEPGPGPATWPDDWRKQIAGDDEKELKRLERLKSPKDLYASYRNLEKKIKQGKDPDPFPEEGTDEEKAEWRKGRGIPDKPEDYIKDFTLDGGLVIGEDDKPIVNKFLEAMHAKHADPSAVKEAINAYYQIIDGQAKERADKDKTDEVTTRDELRDELGKDFTPRLQAAYGLIESAPEDVRDLLLSARLGNGTLLGNHGPTLKWLMDLAMEINPAAAVTPGKGAGTLQSIESEIAEIEKLMRDNRREYYGDERKQERYRQLLEARDKMKKKAA